MNDGTSSQTENKLSVGEIPFELHLAAKQMRREWFKALPESDKAIFRFLIENSLQTK